MNEKEQKVALLTKLDNIDSNIEIVEYVFHSAYLVILNHIEFNTKNDIVKIVLHLDDFMIELYSNESRVRGFSIPYSFLDSFYIFLEDDNDDDKKDDNES